MKPADFSCAKRVLIYRLGSLGDTAVAIPCLHLIAKSFPNAERLLLTNFPRHAKAPASAAVIGDSGLVHGYMRYSVGTRNPVELAGLWWKLVRYKPDVVVYLMPVRPPSAVRRDELFLKLAGIQNIIGLPSQAELTHSFDQTSGLFEGEASRLARSIRALGDANLDNPRNWDLRLTTSERTKAKQVLGPLTGCPFLVCGPGTKMQAKDWGAENWTALLRKLMREFPLHGLVLVGTREERSLCDTVAQGWNGKALNLCGDLSPRETAAVMEHADVFLGPDSGPMHLAASVGVPCVIAFSARGRPGIWYPARTNQHQILYRKVNCFGCYLETCVAEGKKCLTSITVDDMFQSVLLASKRATGAPI